MFFALMRRIKEHITFSCFSNHYISYCQVIVTDIARVGESVGRNFIPRIYRYSKQIINQPHKMIKKEPTVLQELLPRMSKLGRVILSVVFIFIAIAVWLLGSLILIRIDSERHSKYLKFEKTEDFIKEHIQFHCKILEKQRNFSTLGHLKLSDNVKDEGRNTVIKNSDYNNLVDVDEDEPQKIFEKARREKLVRENLIFFPDLKQMWCLAPKAASTSWSRAIVDRLNWDKMQLYVDPKSNFSLQEILRQNYGNINKKVYTSALNSDEIKKILLVRHPFSRVASVYQDKLLDRKARADGMYFFQRYGVRMNRTFRKNRKLNKQKEPTFEEFVDYLINTEPMEYDEHWKPISVLCGLCQVQYDHIIFVEDLNETAEFHMKALDFPSGYRFPRENSHSSKKTDFREPFRNISSLKKLQLLRKYTEDFRLFRYNFISHYTF